MSTNENPEAKTARLRALREQRDGTKLEQLQRQARLKAAVKAEAMDALLRVFESCGNTPRERAAVFCEKVLGIKQVRQ